MKASSVQYDPRNDYYDLLSVSPRATPQDIQRAYRREAKRVHPDLNPDQSAWATEQFQQLNAAYKVLSDPQQRRTYDALRWAHKPQHKRHETSRQTQSKTPYSGPEWWNIPHDSVSGYHGIRRDRPNTRPASGPTPGAWLHKLGLQRLRPFYASLVNLFSSPYRYILWFLIVTQVALLVIILISFSVA
ncbi:MAG: J domain-containing protein [Anaerolineales bacterium]